jgi:hypothetical protein
VEMKILWNVKLATDPLRNVRGREIGLWRQHDCLWLYLWWGASPIIVDCCRNWEFQAYGCWIVPYMWVCCKASLRVLSPPQVNCWISVGLSSHRVVYYWEWSEKADIAGKVPDLLATPSPA